MTVPKESTIMLFYLLTSVQDVNITRKNTKFNQLSEELDNLRHVLITASTSTNICSGK